MKKDITHPDESLREGYRTVEVRTSDGSLIRGVIKNEDTFSLQMMDEHEGFHLLSKASVEEITRPQRSLMPVPNLTAGELDSLIALLKKTEPSEIAPGPWIPSPDLNVSFQRIRNARDEPQNWLTYWGDYEGTHYSGLTSIATENVHALQSQWSFQFAGTNVENTPIVVDGIMFVTGALNNAAALDARTGRPIWRYRRRLPNVRAQCTVMTNRGFAILGDRLYIATLDASTFVCSFGQRNNTCSTCSVRWPQCLKPRASCDWGYSITLAPLAQGGAATYVGGRLRTVPPKYSDRSAIIEVDPSRGPGCQDRQRDLAAASQVGPAYRNRSAISIRMMSRNNPRWGAPRIHGELLKLGATSKTPLTNLADVP